MIRDDFTFTRDMTVPVDADYGMSDDEIRRFLAYGRMPPMMAPGQRWVYPDTFIRLNELLAARPVVCVWDMRTRSFAELKRNWLNKHVDTRAYVCRVEASTQVLVYHRAHWERLTGGHVDDWRMKYSPYEWCTMEEACIRTGYTLDTMKVYLWKHNVESRQINRYGARVYLKSDIEALATRPLNRTAYGQTPPVQQIPYRWYSRRPHSYPLELERHNRTHAQRIPNNLLDKAPNR